MSGRGYTIFDTAIGRCGIAWGDAGIVGVQLPEAREIETRRRMFQLYPDARELRPPLNAEIAIEGIAALLRGEPGDLSDVTLDMTGIPAFNQRVYQCARSHPARRNPHLWRSRQRACAPRGAVHSVAQAIARNPFMIIVPCHRVLEDGSYADKISPNGGAISKRRLLSIEGARSTVEQDPVRRAAPGCAAAPADLNLRHERERPFCSADHLRVRVPLHRGPGRQAVRRALSPAIRSPMCARAVSAAIAAAAFQNWWRDRSWSAIPATNTSAPMTTSRRRMPVVLPDPGTGGNDRRPPRCLAGRRGAAAAGTDGAGRTRANGRRWQQRCRP